MKNIIIAITLCALSIKSFAQTQKLNLHQCIETALRNSYDNKTQGLEVQSTQISQRSVGQNLLPQVNLNANHAYNFGSTIEPSTNSRVSSNIQSNNLGLNASLPLLDFNNFTSVARNAWEVKKAQANQSVIQNQLTANVLKLYFEAFYTQEWLKIQEKQLENTAFVLKRINNEVELGNRPKSDLYDTELSFSQARTRIIETQQSLQSKKLALLQSINLNSIMPNDVVLEDILAENTSTNIEEILDAAYQTKPEIQTLEASNHSLTFTKRMAQNETLPTVQLNYQYSSFYFRTLNQDAVGGDFFTQLNDNKSHYIGFNINIPIFNAFRTKQKVQRANLEISKNQVKIAQEKQKLYQTVQQDLLQFQQAESSLIVHKEAINWAEKSFATTQDKFLNNKTDVFQYNTARNTILNEAFEIIKAQYTLNFLKLRLNFLQTGKV